MALRLFKPSACSLYSMLKIILFLLAATLAVSLLLLLKVRRFSEQKGQLQLLADDARFVTGVVVKKNRRALGKQRLYQLQYAFKATNGRRYRSEIAVAPYIWHCYHPGAAIDVAFISDDPRINSPKYLVSEIRKMMYA
ncbi:MAG: hypothetical protein AAFZ80_02825 [Cyanobacteria bacterium P01_A01_bin.105]